MLNELMTDDDRECEMQRRRITLSDGRYMIFYTFGEIQSALAPTDTTVEQLKSIPPPDTKEERNV
jgi:hypothetical protein